MPILDFINRAAIKGIKSIDTQVQKGKNKVGKITPWGSGTGSYKDNEIYRKNFPDIPFEVFEDWVIFGYLNEADKSMSKEDAIKTIIEKIFYNKAASADRKAIKEIIEEVINTNE